MSEPSGPAFEFLTRGFRRLLPGPTGEEALRDMEGEYRSLRARRGVRLAILWYFGHLLHPNTWLLAIALRRAARGRPDHDLPPHPRMGRAAFASWLDVKLGLRILAKHPVVTLVSSLAMAVTIAVAIGAFTLVQTFLLRPEVPLSEGDRIVALGLHNTVRNRSEQRLLHEFFAWRDELTTVQDVSAWRAETQNIVSPSGLGDLADFARMSASGFAVARVAPLLGRPLLESDQIEGAPSVVVIGYDEWVSRFGGDPQIIGQQARIGRDLHTIVGVMPQGFSFPLSHQLWLPYLDGLSGVVH